MNPIALSRRAPRTVLVRLALLVGVLVTLALAFGGQPFSLGRSRPIASSGGQGYWLLAKDGGVFGFGDAGHHGTNLNSGNDAVGLVPTPSLRGYWIADDDGTVVAYGDAPNHGSRVSNVDDIRGFAARPQGDGYWLVTRDGAVYAFGAAPYRGNTPALGANQKIVGIASTPSGNGYWLVGRDGGIFAFGDAAFHGSTGAITLNQPIVGMARTPSGNGYWFVASDGGVFAFGGAGYRGAAVGSAPAGGITGMTSTPSGNGYWLVGANGKVFPYGDALSYGDAAGLSLRQPVVGISATPVVHTNSVPAPVADSASLAEDGSTSINVMANDAGLADGPIAIALVAGPAHGSASIAGDKKIDYVPSANYHGPDSITYKLTDADGESATAVLSLTVTSVNDAPVASNGTLTTDEDLAAGSTLKAGDIDGGSLTYSIVSAPAHGSVSVSGSNYTYTPAANYHGSDSFTFRANDGSANSKAATVSVTVKPVNDAPVVSNVSVSTDEDTELVGTPSGSDVDGDVLDFDLVDLPENGDLTSNEDGSYSYMPHPNFTGADTLTFKASDGKLGSGLATVTITVVPVDDPGTPIGGVLETEEDESVDGTLTATDVDASSFVIVSGPSHGTISGLDLATGAFTYNPEANYHGSDSFTFAADGDTENEAPATIDITVNSVEDAPVFVAQPEGGSPFIDISSSGHDIGNYSDDSVSLIALPFPVDFYGTTYSGNVSVAPNGWLAFDEANLGYSNQDLPLSSGSPAVLAWWDDLDTVGEPNLGIFTKTIGESPNRQFIVQWNVTHHSQGEGTVSFQAVFTEGSPTVSLRYADTIFPSSADGARSGTVGLNKDATTASPHAFNVTESAAVADGLSLLFDTSADCNLPAEDCAGSVDVDFGNVLSTAEDTDLVLSLPATDGDGDVLTYAIATPPAVEAGTATIDEETGQVTFDPALDFNGSATFTVSVTDTKATVTKTVTVTVLPVNDDPTFAEDSDVSGSLVEEGTDDTGDVDASDVDSNTLSFSIEDGDGPANGSASVDPETGEWSYTGALDFAGSDSFTITVSDGDGGSAEIVVTVNVTNVNDAPTASPIGAQSTDEDEPLVIDFTVGDVDTDDTISITVGSSDLGLLPDGALVLGGSGSDRTLTVNPALNANGSALVFVAVEDGNGGLALQQFVLTVNPVNDLPVANDASVTTPEDTNFVGTVTGSDPVEGSDLDFSVDAEPEHGTVTLDPETGDYTYDPADNYNGPDSFSFLVNDGTNDSQVPGTVTIDVTAVNDAPVADAGSLTIAEDTDGSGTVTGGDPVEGSLVTFALVGDAAHGDVTLNADGSYMYEPTVNYNGPDSFTFVANDGDDASTPATVSITVSPVNDAPNVSDPGSQSMGEDQVKVVNFMASDVDGDVLDIVVGWSNPTLLPAGSVVLDKVTGTITIDTPANLFGEAQIYLSVSDGTAPAVLRQIPLTVTSINDLPVADPGSLTTPEDVSGSGILTGSDPVEGSPLTFALDGANGGAAHGTVTITNAATGAYTYVPNADYNGPDSFGFVANDGTDNSLPAVVTVTVDSVDDLPVANDDNAAATNEDTPLVGIDVLANDTGLGDGGLGITFSNQVGGTASLVGNLVTFTPTADFNGAAGFDYTVEDADHDAGTGHVTLAVTAVNDAPEAADAAAGVNEDAVLNASVPAGTDIDSADLTYGLVSGPANGVLIFNDDGTYSYDSAPDFNGTDSFTYKVNDGTVDSNVATVTITVDPVNDAPVIDLNLTTGPTFDSDSGNYAGTVVATDPDGDTLVWSIDTNDPGVQFTDGSYIWVTGLNPPHTFNISVTDGNSAPVTIPINIPE